MTNAEKYLKDEVDVEELITTMENELPLSYVDVIQFWGKTIKPTLTEDERVILRNITYDSEYKYIYRSLGMLYLSETERLTCVDRLPAMHHLFQFIKERRRIRDKGVIKMRYIEIKTILDTCYENISNLEAIISDIEICYPDEFKKYNDYYDSFIGKEWKKNLRSDKNV